MEITGQCGGGGVKAVVTGHCLLLVGGWGEIDVFAGMPGLDAIDVTSLVQPQTPHARSFRGATAGVQWK